jgi:hypothetical protein
MVKCILISETPGDISEIETNLGADLYTILKGPGTFIGQYPDMNIVVMKCRESLLDLRLNENKLPPPFDDEVVLGPILLVRMNDLSEPENLVYEEFLAIQ